MRDVIVLRESAGLDRACVVLLEQPQSPIISKSPRWRGRQGCTGEMDAVSAVELERAEHTGSGKRERGLGQADEREREVEHSGEEDEMSGAFIRDIPWAPCRRPSRWSLREDAEFSRPKRRTGVLESAHAQSREKQRRSSTQH
jgi:hypothetical protein